MTTSNHGAHESDRDSSRPWPWWFAMAYAWTHLNPMSNVVAVGRAELSPTDRILDIGCGPGAALRQAAGIVTHGALAGVDPSPVLVSIARRRVPIADVRVGTAESLPFPDHTFTVVWAINSFHHWRDVAAGLVEVRRVLVLEGRLLLVERLVTPGAGGHGLDNAAVDHLSNRLIDLGYRQVEDHRAGEGRKKLVLLQASVA